MHIVIRQYKVDPDAVEEIVRRAREGFLPLVSAAPGFVSYSMTDAGEDGLVTVSTFDDSAGAEESVRLAASWVHDNLATLLPAPPRVTRGGVTIRESKEGAQLGCGVLRRYQFKSGDVATVTQLVREGLVPQITAAPGFGVYSIVDAGEGEIVSLSAFTDRAAAEASSRQTLEWVRDHLGSFHPQPPHIVIGEIKLRHGRTAQAR